MVREDEDALICDFAETYHILDYKSLPIRLRATLAAGLHDDSRIKMKIQGFTPVPSSLMLSRIADDLALYRYSWSENAKSGKDKPVLFTEIMLGKTKAPSNDGFASGEDFHRAWNSL